MNSRRDVIAFCVLVALSAAATIPLLMRNQKDVQHTQSDVWPKLTASKVEKHYLEMQYSIAYTPEIKALEGKPVIIDGFVIPLESKDSFQHFLLTIRSPTCSFCPSGKPNEMVEVFSTKPLKWSDELVSMRGTLALMPEKGAEGIFFQLKDAELAKSHPVESQPQAAEAKPISAYRFMELSGDHYRKTKEIALKAAIGKPMLVAFWRSDCAPCLQEMRLLPEIAATNPELSIALISLHDAQHTRNHLVVLPANVRVLVAMDDAKSLLQVFGNERVLALPYSVMLDAKGNACGKHNGILSPDKLKEWHDVCD
jgi:thiol-disulfide isomerase/thioredoxin